MGQESICGVAVEVECPSFEIKQVAAIKFFTEFLDYIADKFDAVAKPKVNVSFFEVLENSPLAVTIIPNTVNGFTLNGEGNASPMTFITRFNLASNKEQKAESFAELMLLARFLINFIEYSRTAFGLTYISNLGISNSKEAVLTVTITKRL